MLFRSNKWWFDELYDWCFIRPTHVVSRVFANIDRNWIDGFLHLVARVTKSFSSFWARLADQTVIDGFVNLLAAWMHSLGLSMRQVQTGKLRQYVMFIVAGALALFVLDSVKIRCGNTSCFADFLNSCVRMLQFVCADFEIGRAHV